MEHPWTSSKVTLRIIFQEVSWEELLSLTYVADGPQLLPRAELSQTEINLGHMSLTSRLLCIPMRYLRQRKLLYRTTILIVNIGKLAMSQAWCWNVIFCNTFIVYNPFENPTPRCYHEFHFLTGETRLINGK